MDRERIPDFLDKLVCAYICNRLILRLTRSPAKNHNSILYVIYSVEEQSIALKKKLPQFIGLGSELPGTASSLAGLLTVKRPAFNLVQGSISVT